ncbi:inositol monophosphatase family protein [Halopseudomonas salina]|uniref:Inositol-1-monophosphatase n=1 Tax=Halopseudomonas salina TaxID=1323744 RepID=A0ABQ1NYQ3_9GAMM|nr:inositol monophosphatase family protein [Halopseudomonas salina]GGC87686.1 inositol-1-monophosphatase [Halopseudomonas salina]
MHATINARTSAPDLSQIDLDARYTLAQELALAAARQGKTRYNERAKLTIEHKNNDFQDVVSEVDRQLEDLIRQTLAKRFPEDGFVGEESGAAQLSARCVWVVDPIDGTACFVNGLHSWCVSIGMMIDGVPCVGAIADPNHDELFHGCIGRGAFVNNTPLRVSQASDIREGLTGVGTFHPSGKENFLPFLQKLLADGGMFIRNGSGALTTAYVAAGRLIGYYETQLKSWDCMAGLVLVAEAGGRRSDFLRGEGLLQGNPFLVAAPGVYDQLARMIGPSLDED